MSRRAVRRSLVIAAFVLAGCDDTVSTTSSGNVLSGWLNVHLTTAPQGSEALLFQVVGGPIDSISSQNYTVFANAQASDQVRVLLVGNLTKEVVARIWVPDPSAIARYNLILEQAASERDFEQQSVSGYSMKLEAATKR
jgi:hypothetical protein